MKTVVGLYNRFEDAQQAIRDLNSSGFRKEEINLIARDEKGTYTRELEQAKGKGVEAKEGAATGAGVGAAVGGLGGLLVGLGLLTIPGIGPIIAAGPIVTTLAGAGTGAVAGGLIGVLVNLGIPEEHAKFYSEGVRAGGSLVTVQTDDQRAKLAAEILGRYNPVDVTRRAETGRTKETRQERMERTRTEQEMGAIPVTGETTFPVVEEQARVGKREVETGGVRIHTYTREEPFEEQVNLRKERVDVERRPVDRPATDADFEAFKEGSMEMTEKEERAFVEKESRVVEEIHVSKDVEEETSTVRDTLRHTEVDIERLGPDFQRHETGYREHYRTSYANSGHDYAYYRPGYAYGYQLANDERFRGKDWRQVEQEARRDWERRGGQGPWEDFKDAVRSAWESARR